MTKIDIVNTPGTTIGEIETNEVLERLLREDAVKFAPGWIRETDGNLRLTHISVMPNMPYIEDIKRDELTAYVRLKLSFEDMERLDFCAQVLHIDKNDVIKQAITVFSEQTYDRINEGKL